MSHIKAWQDSMREVDGWDEAVDLIDKDDIKRWNADKKMDTQKFKSALDLAVKSNSVRSESWDRVTAGGSCNGSQICPLKIVATASDRKRDVPGSREKGSQDNHAAQN